MTLVKCRTTTKVKKIKVEERGKKATFLNNNEQEFLKTRIDGCMVCNELAADWIVSRQGIGDVVIELKGKDIEHGSNQIIAAAAFWTREKLRNGRISGLIVGTRYPRMDTSVQKAKEKFAKKFGGPLYVVNSNREYVFEKVLEFGGPL